MDIEITNNEATKSLIAEINGSTIRMWSNVLAVGFDAGTEMGGHSTASNINGTWVYGTDALDAAGVTADEMTTAIRDHYNYPVSKPDTSASDAANDRYDAHYDRMQRLMNEQG